MRPLLPYFLLVAAVLAAFGNCLRAPFHFDDFALFSDPAVVSASGWLDCWRLTQSRPLTWFTFWLNYRLGGRDPILYHAFNLALHVASSLLLFSCLRRLLPRPAAWIAAFVFALHPAQTEAIVYVWARGSLLTALFCLLSFREWLRGHHWRAAAWFLPAVLAKEECAAFPVFLGLLHLSISRNSAELRPLLTMLIAAGAAVVRVAILTAITPGSGAGPQAGVGPLEYLATQGYVILRYFQLLAIPVGFTIDPDIPVLYDWRGLLCWIAVAGIVWFCFGYFSKARPGFWLLAGLALLAPTSSIFPAADLAADRRLYLPMIAFAPLAGLLLQRTQFPILLPAGAIVYLMLSFARTDAWLSPQALWEDAMRWAPAKSRPRVQLAKTLPPPQAIRLLEEAKFFAPDDPAIASELGRIYLHEGKASEALTEFGRVAALRPNDAVAFNNRGVALLLIGMKEHAIADFRRAVELDPCLHDARLNLRKTGDRTPVPARCRWTEEQRRQLETESDGR